MGWYEDAIAWLAVHHSTRKFLNGIGVFVVGFLITELPTWMLNWSLQTQVMVSSILIPGLLALQNWLSHNTGGKAPNVKR